MAPAVVAVIGVIASVASTAVSVYSAVSSSRTEASSEKRAKRQAQIQADEARRQAEEAKKAAAQRESDFRKKARVALSMERAERGAQGVTMEGSPLISMFANMEEYEEQARRIREGGEAEATGWLKKAEVLGLGAAQHGDYAKATQTAGYVQAGQTLLTGATNFFQQGQKMGWF